MSGDRKRRWLEPAQACIVIAILTAVIICVLSNLSDRSRRELASSSPIDLLSGNPADHWAVFGALTTDDVRLKQTGDGVVQIDTLAKTPSSSDVSSGVSYTVGLFSPDWYEFSGEFQAEVDDSKGIGAQLEVHSGRWRFLVKARPRKEGSWEKVNVYFRPAYSDPGAEISCRFWGGAADQSGKVFLRNMRITRIDGDPPPTADQFDLEKTEEARLGTPERLRNGSVPPRHKTHLVGFHNLGIVLVLSLVMIVGVCWRLLD